MAAVAVMVVCISQVVDVVRMSTDSLTTLHGTVQKLDHDTAKNRKVSDFVVPSLALLDPLLLPAHVGLLLCDPAPNSASPRAAARLQSLRAATTALTTRIAALEEVVRAEVKARLAAEERIVNASREQLSREQASECQGRGGGGGGHPRLLPLASLRCVLRLSKLPSVDLPSILVR